MTNYVEKIDECVTNLIKIANEINKNESFAFFDFSEFQPKKSQQLPRL